MAGSGRGRGRIIRLLLGADDCSSLEQYDSVNEALDPATNSSSGIGDSQTSVTTSKSSGRGKIIQLLTGRSTNSEALASTSTGSPMIESSTSDSGFHGRGKGRGSLIKTFMSEAQTCAAESSTSGSTPLSSEKEKQIEHPLEKLKLSDEVEIKDTGEMSEEELDPIIKKGKHGNPVRATTNYIRLKTTPDKGIFQYDVCFNPNIDSRNERFRYLNEHRDVIGPTKTFDGSKLYLPIKLKDKITRLESKNPNNQKIAITITYKFSVPFKDRKQFYNILFDRIMKTLNYVRIDRKQYDPTAPKIIPQYKLEIWPGYVTAVDEYEGGIMLCCDVSHRVLCQLTVLDKMKEIYRASKDRFQFKDNCKRSLLGAVVLTRYNNKHYRIDDINFDLNPQSTFKLSNGEDISYCEYYKNHYNIELTDMKQPLLISIKERRISGRDEKEELVFCLMPEICHLSGLQDETRSDTRVMKELQTFMKVTPNQRILALEKFYKNVNECQETREILSNWGLELDSKPEKIICRQFQNETAYFANTQCSIDKSFGSKATQNNLLEVVNINSWLLIHTRNTTTQSKTLIDHMLKVASPMGIRINRPIIEVLNDDRNDSYVNALRKFLKPNIQIVVLICPSARDDRYSAIKKICCNEIPIPSQVINSRTLSNESKNRSIVQKIVLQMNCKLGGTLWSIKIPLKKVMICGIDSFHEASGKGNSVAAFVASYNETFTKYFSRTIIQSKKEEIVNGLCQSLKLALAAYEKANNYLPDKIVIYRDGVGDGQLKQCSDYEVPQLISACHKYEKDYNPTLTFIVVQKRINTRIFAEDRDSYKNPDPGFVLDHTVTRKYLYDFFLISQSVREGTVTPTHYIVVTDNSGLDTDIIQRMSYKLCYLYYNWPGSIRVPACCQYAHKLAYLVGEHIKRPVSESLADKLFFL